MLKSVVAALAVLTLCGFTEQDAYARFGGGWQSDDDTHGTRGAIQIDPAAHFIRAGAYSEIVEGKIDSVDIMGASAIFRVGKKTIVIYSGNDPDVIEANVGSIPTMRFVRVP